MTATPCEKMIPGCREHGRSRRSIGFRLPIMGMLMAAMLLLSPVVSAALTSAAGTVLYDGSMGTTPDYQGWFYLPFETAAVQSNDGTATLLDTSADNGIQAGYSMLTLWPLGLILNRNHGFTISFEVQLLSEAHASNDRAGFSVIVLTSDLEGIEIGFWEGEIWAQSATPLFTHSEGASFDTTQSHVRYDLAIFADTYNLSADGVTILQGPLRNYSAHWHEVYQTENYLFFGDDTTSASALMALASVRYVDFAKTVNGDIDGSRQVGLSDAVMTLKIIAGLYPESIPEGYGDSGADIGGDGAVSMAELLYIFQLLAGLR
jgi:hypothetical protein